MEKLKLTPDLIVTRHKGLVDYLFSFDGAPIEGENVLLTVPTDCPVLEHATPDDLRGKVVCGVLPMSMADHARLVVELALRVPPEMRGRELTAEEMRPYVSPPRVYRVNELITGLFLYQLPALTGDDREPDWEKMERFMKPHAIPYMVGMASDLGVPQDHLAGLENILKRCPIGDTTTLAVRSGYEIKVKRVG